MSQTLRAGDQLSGGHSAAGEGSGPGLVLQPQAEREAHDAAWSRPDPGGRVLTGGQHGSRHSVSIYRLQEDVQRHVKTTLNIYISAASGHSSTKLSLSRIQRNKLDKLGKIFRPMTPNSVQISQTNKERYISSKQFTVDKLSFERFSFI